MLDWSTFNMFETREVFKFIVYANQIIFEIGQHMILFLNICFCHDLLKTLRNPFEKAKYRLWWYLFISFTIPVIYSIIIYTVTDSECPNIYYNTTPVNYSGLVKNILGE
jgi:uncharacterized protein with PQ loop repeat